MQVKMLSLSLADAKVSQSSVERKLTFRNKNKNENENKNLHSVRKTKMNSDEKGKLFGGRSLHAKVSNLSGISPLWRSP
jgi:hypothetical protein